MFSVVFVVVVVVIVHIVESKGHLRTQMLKGFSTVLRAISRQGVHSSYLNAYTWVRNVTRLVIKKGHANELCWLVWWDCSMSMDNILGSIANRSGDTYVITLKGKKIKDKFFSWISYNYGFQPWNLKQKKFAIHDCWLDKTLPNKIQQPKMPTKLEVPTTQKRALATNIGVTELHMDGYTHFHPNSYTFIP